jgi:hypothetical protein
MIRELNYKLHFFSIVIIFSIIFVVFFVFFSYLSAPRRTAVAHLEVNPEKKEYFQIYWRKDSSHFKEAHSNGMFMSKRKRILTIQLGDLYSIRYLRIDPLRNIGTITIKKIEITQPGFIPIVFKKKEDFKKIVPVQQIGELSILPEGLKITSAGSDPILQIRLEPHFRASLMIKYFLAIIFSALIVTAIIYLIYWFAKFILSSIGKDRQKKLFAISFSIVLLIRLIFIVTFPLNIAGDGKTYFNMISGWYSHLALAGGYPFFFGILKSFFDTLTIIETKSIAYKYFLLVLQHMTDLGVLMLMYLLLEKIFSASVACTSVLCYSINPFIIGHISTTRPEWFQSNLLLLSMLIAYLGYSTHNSKKKQVYYVGASLIFTLGFFVKFNLLPLASFFLVFAFLDKVLIREKLKILAIIMLCCSIFYGTYTVLYHKPSTGTSALTHDKSWILMRKTHAFSSNPNLNIENGINTKRFKLLTWFLWSYGKNRSFHPNHLYRHIDAVPQDIRKPFQERYGYLLSAKEDKLNQLIEENPTVKHFLGDQLLISYNIGLKESDRLGTRVFFETVRSEPAGYLKNVWQGFYKSFLIKKKNNFPLNENLGWNHLSRPKAFDPDKHLKKRMGFGFSLIRVRHDRSIGYEWWPGESPILWIPGINLFSILCHIFHFWIPVAWIACLAIVPACLIDRIKRGIWVKQNFIPIILAALIVFFMFWSNMVYRFRAPKEFILITPYLCIFSGLFLIKVLMVLKHLFTRLIHKQLLV